MLTFRKLMAGGPGRAFRQHVTTTTAQPAVQGAAQRYRHRSLYAEVRRDLPPAVAAALGLAPGMVPNPAELDRLFEGRNAKTGALWPGRVRRVVGYDFTVSAPKSLSVAALLARTTGEREALLLAHQLAADEAVHHVVSIVGHARRGRGGRCGAQPAEVGWVSFEHHTARPTVHAAVDGGDLARLRPGDPDVHTHHAVFAAAITEDGHVGSIDGAALRGRVHEAGAYYQARLAQRLRQLGVALGPPHPLTGGVRLAAVPETVVEALSRRTRDATADARRHAAEVGLDWERLPLGVQVRLTKQGALRTRRGRGDDLSDREAWLTEVRALGWEPTSVIGQVRHMLRPRHERLLRAGEIAASSVGRPPRDDGGPREGELRTRAAWALVPVGCEGPADVEAVAEVLRKAEVTATAPRRRARIEVLLREGRAAEALALKREGGGALLLPGPYAAVIGRAAGLLLERRASMGGAITAIAPTPEDAEAIGAEVRRRLQASGEVGPDLATVPALSADGLQAREMPLAVGDRVRLHRPAPASVEGSHRGGTVGRRGSVATVAGVSSSGVDLVSAGGRTGHVRWSTLTDGAAGRVQLSPAWCLTVDDAHGIVAGDLLLVLPRGTAEASVSTAWPSLATRATLAVAVEPEREAVGRQSRPMGDGAVSVTEEEVWASVARSLARATPLPPAIAEAARHRAALMLCLTDHWLETAALDGSDPTPAAAQRRQLAAAREVAAALMPLADAPAVAQFDLGCVPDALRHALQHALALATGLRPLQPPSPPAAAAQLLSRAGAASAAAAQLPALAQRASLALLALREETAIGELELEGAAPGGIGALLPDVATLIANAGDAVVAVAAREALRRGRHTVLPRLARAAERLAHLLRHPSSEGAWVRRVGEGVRELGRAYTAVGWLLGPNRAAEARALLVTPVQRLATTLEPMGVARSLEVEICRAVPGLQPVGGQALRAASGAGGPAPQSAPMRARQRGD